MWLRSLTRLLCIVDYITDMRCGSQEGGRFLNTTYLPMDMRKNSYLNDDAFIVQVTCKEAMTSVICLRNNTPPPLNWTRSYFTYFRLW